MATNEIITAIEVPRRMSRTHRPSKNMPGGTVISRTRPWPSIWHGKKTELSRHAFPWARWRLCRFAPSLPNAPWQAWLTDSAVRAAAEMVIAGALPLSDNGYKCNLIVNLTERALRKNRDQRA